MQAFAKAVGDAERGRVTRADEPRRVRPMPGAPTDAWFSDRVRVFGRERAEAVVRA